MTDISFTLAVKLASLVVHVQEIDPGAIGRPSLFDLTAAHGLANDDEVVAWLATLDPVFLPVKR